MKRLAVVLALFAWMGLVVGAPAFAGDKPDEKHKKESKGGKLYGSDKDKKDEKKDKGGH